MLKRFSLVFLLILVLLSFSAVHPALAQTTQQLKLKTGFNFVSFTVVPSVTLAEFKTQNVSIEDVYLFSAAAGGFLSFGDSSLTSIGAGKGYIIKSSADATIDFGGTAVSTINNINLKAGFNLVGFSKNPEIALTCSQLMARSASIKGVYSWSAAAGSFVAVVRNAVTGAVEQLDGSDPVITAGRSYFINMNSDETLNYDGSSVTITGGAPIPVNPALTDIAISGFAKKAIIAFNSNGVAEGAETEAVGVLPASVNGPAKMIMNFDPARSGMKDRYFANRAPSMQTGVRTRPIITENDQKYTFKVTEGTATKDLATSKVYGTATSKCLIFLDDAVTTTYNWDTVGQKFDNEIYSAMTGAFGDPTDIDANGKVVILYYDMGAAESTTYGYFMSGDLSLGSDGNEMEVFYMNIKFGIETGSAATADPLDPELIRTLSHEFEHLINYGQRVMIKKINRMDSWMDEGLAESAEQLVGKTPGTGRINTFKSDSENKIGRASCRERV